jgi:hypothetical protein
MSILQATADQLPHTAHDAARWRAEWTLKKWHRRDKEGDGLKPLEYRIEYRLPEEDGRRFHTRQSPVLAGMEEARRFWTWLLGREPLADCPAFYDRPDFFRPRLVELDTPDEVLHHIGNLLMYGGVSCIWEALKGNGTATAGQALTYFSNAQAAIGVGDSSTAAAATQTDLQASSNKLRVAMDSTYPTHTDGVVSGSATITFQSTFATGQANYAWNEVATFNSATAATGRMLQRLASGFGTKASGAWAMNLAVTIA